MRKTLPAVETKAVGELALGSGEKRGFGFDGATTSASAAGCGGFWVNAAECEAAALGALAAKAYSSLVFSFGKLQLCIK